MNNTFKNALEEIVGSGNVLVDEPLAAHTTFEVGGPSDYFVRPSSEEQVASLVRACAEYSIDRYMLGHGSNLLVADEGIRGVVIQIADNMEAVEVVDGDCVRAQAGAGNDEVARVCQAAGLAGYEFASGIPGSIGGAAIMNAGAYDGQFSDVAVSVCCVTPDGQLVEVAHDEAEWGYRKSRMNDEGMIVVSALLRLAHDDPSEIQARIDDLAARRAASQPLEMPSAGSTFKRPEGYFAGKLIQDAGLQGLSVGGAQVSTKHAGFVVNAGGATAADILSLIREVQRRVFENSGVHLEPEVRMWGF